MDQLQSIRIFEKVVEQGSFVAAGEALDMTTAMITRHIANLEKHLNTRLLNRSTRSLSMTESGKVYFERAQQILRAVDDADATVTAQSQTPSGTLRILSTSNFGHTQLMRLLPDYAQQFPDVTLDVTMSSRSVDLVEEGFDVGIFIDFQKFDANMIARSLAAAELIMCASPSYIQRHGVPVVPEDVSKHACLNFSYEQLRDHWPIKGGSGPSANVPIKSKAISNSGKLLRHLALSGLGIFLCASYCAEDALKNGELVRLLPDHDLGQLSVVMVYSSRRLLSAKVRSFVDFMCARFPNPSADPWLIKEERAAKIAKLAA